MFPKCPPIPTGCPRALTSRFDHVGLAGAAVEAFIRSLLHLLLRQEAVARRMQPPAGGRTRHAPLGHPKYQTPPHSEGPRCSPIAVPALDEQVVLHVFLAAEGADDQAGAGRAVGVVVLPLAVEAGGRRPALHAAHAPFLGGETQVSTSPETSRGSPRASPHTRTICTSSRPWGRFARGGPGSRCGS